MAIRGICIDLEKLLNKKITQLYRVEKQAKKFPLHGRRRALLINESLVLSAEIRVIEVLKTDNIFSRSLLSDEMLKYRTKETKEDVVNSSD